MTEGRVPGMTLSRHMIEFIRNEEQMLLSATYPSDSDREQVMEMYHKSKITAADMLREFTPEEVRMLCERTKVRVNMTRMNVVWDAKKRFDKKKRLENKSEEWVNRMFEKAHRRRMVAPYSELERERYKDFDSCHTKKENVERLKRWHSKRLASESNAAPANTSISSSFEPEGLSEPQGENTPPLCVEPPPVSLESQPQTQSEPNLWDIGDQDELGEAECKDEPPAAVADTQLNSCGSDVYWQQAAGGINSESLSIETIISTQNTEAESPYECFGAKVVAASTQDPSTSEPFL